MPGPLVIFGNPLKRGKTVQSETDSWNAVSDIAHAIEAAAKKGDTDFIVKGARRIREYAILMKGQVRRGVHANPHDLSKDTIISRHVQAIAYVHAKDGGQYVHGFGNVDPSEADLKKGWLNLNQLKMTTHVELIAHPDGTASLIGTRGQPLAALFE